MARYDSSMHVVTRPLLCKASLEPLPLVCAISYYFSVTSGLQMTFAMEWGKENGE